VLQIFVQRASEESMHNFIWGVDYYPEQWEKKRWAEDAVRIRNFGFTHVRIMEFAWALLEPVEGTYDFTLFDEAIQVLYNAGLQVVLGTPTATFPIWLLEKDPSIRAVFSNRMDRDFGARRLACLNNKTYRDAARKLVTAVAEHFAENPAVAGWQIDNEIGHEGSDHCICASCERAWHEWLQKKYGTIKNLNETWGTVFWSTSYSRFEQVPVPRSQPATQQNPSLILDYDRFMSDTNVDFVHEQAAILRRFCGKKHWITTNLYPSPLSQCIDMKKLFEPLDIAAYDNYPVWGDQSEPVPYIFTNYALAYTRGLKSTGNFAIMEQFTGIQGHTKLGYLPPPEQVVLWTNQAVAHGADRLFYFRWRTAPFAQEQLCYGIFDTDNEDTPRSKKIKENIEHTAELFNSFAGNPVSAQACLVYTRDNANLIRQQPLSTGLENWMNSWSSVGFDAELARWYAGFSIFNVEADVKPAEAVTLQNYKLISLPLYELADPAFAQKIDAWVKDGGVLVLGWRAGARTLENWNIDKPLPGIFSEMAGVQVEAFEALGKGSIGVRRGFLLGKGEVWAEQLIPYTAEVIARYGGTRWINGKKAKVFYSGKPAITRNQHGKGFVYYIGTSPDAVLTFILYKKILHDAGIKARFKGYGIEVVQRTLNDGNTCTLLLNHTDKTRRVCFKTLPPYGFSWKIKRHKR